MFLTSNLNQQLPELRLLYNYCYFEWNCFSNSQSRSYQSRSNH